MAKRSTQGDAGPLLYDTSAIDRRIRRQRALFIPKLVREEAAGKQLGGPAQDRAHAIAVHWAELETRGELAKHKETSIDTQFLDHLFGEGLGYLLKTRSPGVFDYVTRQKIGGITLNFFIVEQLPTLPPDIYADKCPWSKRETLEQWISERILKLSCTAEDMIPLAHACGFKGSRGDGVHIWKEGERAQLRAELDAAYFILYGVERADVEYMLSTFANTGFIPADERGNDGPAWTRGGVGEQVLDAYDHLTGLHTS